MKIKLVSFAILSVFLLVPSIAFAEVTSVGYGSITPGRLLTLVAALVGLSSAVVAGIAYARPTSRFATGQWPVMSIVLSLFCVLLSAFHLAVTPNGFNTGNGTRWSDRSDRDWADRLGACWNGLDALSL